MSQPPPAPVPSATSQYPPPAAPGQYPPPGVPGQYPPAGVPGQYPPPGAPGQCPPPAMPGQYTGQYPPPGAPGQYPPPGAPGQYPPPGAPGQYPPPGAPGQYPPPGAPGQYPPPGAPGQYPPPGTPGQYPPPGAPGQYPPPGVPGQYPPQGALGQYPPPGNYPSHGTSHRSGNLPPTGLPPLGWDAVDSDNEDIIYSKHDRVPVEVNFVNKTNQKVSLYWISEKGKFKKMGKLKEGRSEVVETYQTHPFMVDAKGPYDVVINGNPMFFPEALPGHHGECKAEITIGPENFKALRSTISGHPVRIKFSNRTHKYAVIKWVDQNGHHIKLKEIAPKKAWVLDSFEGHYFIAFSLEDEDEELALNYGFFYCAKKSAKPVKVLITERLSDSSSSSS